MKVYFQGQDQRSDQSWGYLILPFGVESITTGEYSSCILELWIYSDQLWSMLWSLGAFDQHLCYLSLTTTGCNLPLLFTRYMIDLPGFFSFGSGGGRQPKMVTSFSIGLSSLSAGTRRDMNQRSDPLSCVWQIVPINCARLGKMRDTTNTDPSPSLLRPKNSSH